jgi:RimJ/RimL family protein N-acetyltransferase
VTAADEPEPLLRIDQPIRTERLILRPLSPDDLNDFEAYASRPDVLRFLPWPLRDRSGIAAHLSRRLATTLTRSGDVVVLGIELPPKQGGSGRLIGDLTLRLIDATENQAEIGWVLHPDFQGHGLASEAALRLLHLAFEELGAHRVVANLDARNLDSAKLCHRLGLRQEGHFVHDHRDEDGWADSLVFAILDAEWKARIAIDGA